MDIKKDMQKGDALARFIDAQTVHTNPFGENRVGERAYANVERVVAGLHMLTAHISENEPIRERIRREAIELLARTLALRDEMRAIESTSIGSFQTSIRYLISLVRTLTAGGFVSFQNAEVVIAALDELSGFLGASQRTALAERIAFVREDFIGHSGPLAAPTKRTIQRDIKDTLIVKDSIYIKDKDMSDTNMTSPVRTPNSQERTQSIMEVLRSGGDFSIRDIVTRLPDYSEKMIQRELAVLVQGKKVKKEGEKRWSRYSLI